MLRAERVREPDGFGLLLVTADRDAYERIVDGLADDIHTLLHGAADTVERRDELGPSGAGKFRSVVALDRVSEYV